jgi:hypothetical protein
VVAATTKIRRFRPAAAQRPLLCRLLREPRAVRRPRKHSEDARLIAKIGQDRIDAEGAETTRLRVVYGDKPQAVTPGRMRIAGSVSDVNDRGLPSGSFHSLDRGRMMRVRSHSPPEDDIGTVSQSNSARFSLRRAGSSEQPVASASPCRLCQSEPSRSWAPGTWSRASGCERAAPSRSTKRSRNRLSSPTAEVRAGDDRVDAVVPALGQRCADGVGKREPRSNPGPDSSPGPHMARIFFQSAPHEPQARLRLGSGQKRRRALDRGTGRQCGPAEAQDRSLPSGWA